MWVRIQQSSEETFRFAVQLSCKRISEKNVPKVGIITFDVYHNSSYDVSCLLPKCTDAWYMWTMY